MTRRTSLDLSRRERQIIDILYADGRATAAEVQELLPDPPSYSAVRAMLRILEDKGHVRHHAGRAALSLRADAGERQRQAVRDAAHAADLFRRIHRTGHFRAPRRFVRAPFGRGAGSPCAPDRIRPAVPEHNHELRPCSTSRPSAGIPCLQAASSSKVSLLLGGRRGVVSVVLRRCRRRPALLWTSRSWIAGVPVLSLALPQWRVALSVTRSRRHSIRRRWRLRRPSSSDAAPAGSAGPSRNRAPIADRGCANGCAVPGRR